MISKFYSKILLVFVLIGGLMLFNYGPNQRLRSSVFSLFKKPLSLSYSYIGRLKFGAASWFKIGKIVRENELLSRENRALFAANIKITDLERENEFLRKELGVAQKKSWHLEAAKIFQLRSDGAFSTAVIDKGSNDGISAGWPVIFDGDILFGVTKDVMPASSVVYLTNDPRLAISVKIKDSLVLGRTKGALESGIDLDLISNQEEIKEGDMALTSGLDGLPSSLIIGIVKSVNTKNNQLFRAVKIQPGFEGRFLESVFILKP